MLTNEDVDGSCHMPSGIYDYCVTMTSLSGKGAPFIRACIENPRAVVDDPSVNLIFRYYSSEASLFHLVYSLICLLLRRKGAAKKKL